MCGKSALIKTPWRIIIGSFFGGRPERSGPISAAAKKLALAPRTAFLLSPAAFFRGRVARPSVKRINRLENRRGAGRPSDGRPTGPLLTGRRSFSLRRKKPRALYSAAFSPDFLFCHGYKMSEETPAAPVPRRTRNDTRHDEAFGKLTQRVLEVQWTSGVWWHRDGLLLRRCRGATFVFWADQTPSFWVLTKISGRSGFKLPILGFAWL